MLQVNALIIN